MFFRSLVRGIRRTILYFHAFGGGLVYVFLLITFLDVMGRWFRHPLPGALEMSELALGAMVVFTWAQTQAEKGHISVDLVFSHIPPRAQGIIEMTTSLLAIAFVALVCYQSVVYALDARAAMEWTDWLRIPVWPFKFLILIGGIAFGIQLIFSMVDGYKQFKEPARGNIA